MRIGIIGCGIVGEATAHALTQRGHQVERRDPDKGHYADGPFDVAFVCVPTPLLGDGILDDAIVYAVEASISARIMVIRSTLPLRHIDVHSDDVVYMPCFSREDYAKEEEAKYQHRIYGGEKGAVEVVAALFDDPYTRVDFRTAEFIKLALNAKLATDISFATEMADAAKEFGVAWDTVAEALKKDRRIGKDAYLRPGPFGGKCLPKDTTNLATQTRSRLLKAVLEINDGHRDESIVQEEYVHGNSR